MFVYLSLLKIGRYGIYGTKIYHIQGSHTQNLWDLLLCNAIKVWSLTSHDTSNSMICNLRRRDIQNTMNKNKEIRQHEVWNMLNNVQNFNNISSRCSYNNHQAEQRLIPSRRPGWNAYKSHKLTTQYKNEYEDQRYEAHIQLNNLYILNLFRRKVACKHKHANG